MMQFYSRVLVRLVGTVCFVGVLCGGVSGQAIIFEEELRDGSLPAGWSQNDVSFQTAAGGYARLDAGGARLTTPVFDGSAFNAITVLFDVAKFGTGGDGPVTVEFSLNGGTDWEPAGDSPIPEDANYLNSLIKIPLTSDNMAVRFTRPNSPSQKRLRDVIIQEGTYIIDFEGDGETKGGYAAGTVNLSGLDWELTDVLIGTLENDFKNGDRSARMRGYSSSVMEMTQDKPGGLGTVSFVYRRFGSDGGQQPVAVEYSDNAGGSWTQIGNNITATAAVQTFNETVNVQGDIRLRFRTVTAITTGSRRMNIDDIEITDFFAPAEITTGNVSAAEFTQTECTGTVTGTVDFTVDGLLSAVNTFTAELSDVDGNFAEPLAIGTLAGNAGGTINFTLPENTAAGTGYRIRVVSDLPPVTGTVSDLFTIVQTGEYCPEQDDYRSQGSGDWTEFGTWEQYVYNAESKSREWQTSTSQPNDRFRSVYIEPGHQVKLNSSSRIINHLLIAQGGRLWRDGGDCGDLNYINLHGDIRCDGSFGNGSTRDALGINIQAGPHRIFGTGEFDAFRIRLSNQTTPSLAGAGSLEIDIDITLHWRGAEENCSGSITPGVNAIYNNRGLNQNFDVVINAGSTLRIDHPSGGVGMDGTYSETGYVGANSGGGYTVFGTIDCAGVVFLGSNNTASHLPYMSIEEGATLRAGYLDYGLNNDGGNSVSGSLSLKADAVLEITGTGAAWRNTDKGAISFTGTIGSPPFTSEINPTATVIYSAAGNQTFPAFFPYPNAVFAGSGTKTFTPLTGPNSLTFTGSVDIQAGTFNPAGRTVNVAGDWTDYGSAGFVQSGSTVNFNGTGTQNISCPGGEIFNILIFSGSGEKTFNSEADFTVESDFTMSGSAAAAASEESGLDISGNLTVTGSASWTESAFDNLDVRTLGNGTQTYTGNGNPIRCYNFRSDKSGGSLTLAANTPVDAKNNFRIKRTGSSSFTDGGNEITLGDDLVLTGAAARFNFTGTLVMTGENGPSNDIGDENDNACLAHLNNLRVKGSGTNNNTRIRPNGGHTLVIKGNLDIEDGTPGLPGLLDSRDNTIQIGGNWANFDEAGFRERNGRVVYNGAGDQTITCPGGEQFHDLTFAGSGQKIFNNGGEFRVANDFDIENNSIVAAVNNPSPNLNLYVGGDLTMSGSASWNESSYENLRLRSDYSTNQNFSAGGTGNLIRCFNFRLDKPTGNLSLAANTDLDLKNNLEVNYETSGQFNDGGNTVTLGDDLTLTGAAARFDLTGTIVMTGENGPSNDIGDKDEEGCEAHLNNLRIRGSGTGNNTRIFPGEGGHTLVIKGNLYIEDGTPGLPGLLDSRDNTIEIGGNWTNHGEDGFDEGEGQVVFNGTGTQLLSCPGGEIFHGLEFAGNGEKVFNSQGTYTVNGDFVKSENAVTEASEEVTLELRGNLTMTEDSEWGDGAYDLLDIDARGSGNQTFAANANPIRCYNFEAFKTGGNLDLAAESSVEAKNDVDLEMQGAALFRDNFNTITLGDDLQLKGNGSNRYLLFGTFVMTGEQGGTNNIQSEGNTAPVAELNNLLVNGSGANVTVDPLEGGDQTIFKGDVFVTAGLLNAQGNTLFVGGDWSTYGPAAFAEAGSTVNFNGTSTQLIEGSGLQTFYRAEFSQSGAKNLAANATVGEDFIIRSGSGTVNAGNAQIFLEGDWLNEAGTATFDPGSGSVSFEGESVQTVTSPGGAAFHNVELANNGGGISLNHDMIVTENGEIEFSNGIVHTEGNEVVMNQGASHSGASAFSYVSGFVRKIGFAEGGEFTFPVGQYDAAESIDVYQPAGVIPASDAPDGEFRAAYFHDNFTPGFENPNNRPPRDASMQSGTVSTCNYWIIEHPDGTPEFSARVKLSWGASDCIEIQDNTFLTVARWNGFEWDNQAQTAVTGAPFAQGEVTSGVIDSFSPFAIGTSGADPNILPVTLLSFTAEAVNNDVVETRWITASETNNDFFTIERSTDAREWESIGTKSGAGNSNTSISYAYADDAPYPGTSYYRLRQTDYDGTTVVTEPRPVYIAPNYEAFELHKVYRSEQGIDAVYTAAAPYLTVEIFDISGRLVYGEVLQNSGSHLSANARLARGVYIMRVSDNRQAASMRFFY